MRGGDDNIWRYSLDIKEAEEIKRNLNELADRAEIFEQTTFFKDKPTLSILKYLLTRIDSLTCGSMNEEKVKTKNSFDLIELALRSKIRIN